MEDVWDHLGKILAFALLPSRILLVDLVEKTTQGAVVLVLRGIDHTFKYVVRQDGGSGGSRPGGDED